MQEPITNLFQSKARLMVIMRYVLLCAVSALGVIRLRVIILLLASPGSLLDRDTLTYYLMGKAVIAGLNPYLPLNELALKFVGSSSFLPHPAPCTPTMAILSVPIALFSFSDSVVIWLGVELFLLAAIACMLTVLWNGRLHWLGAILLFLGLLAWYPVMVDLLFGQLSILLTALLLAALLFLRKDQKILAGILIGFTVGIKIITWPLIVYFALKKDWRSFFSSSLTVVGLNLIATLVIGIRPIIDYYFGITMQVSAIYYSFLKNYSLWSIGYRLFNGTQPISGDYISAPPLINLPKVAPLVSAGLAIAFLIVGFIWSIRSKDKEIAFSIVACVIVAVSPIAWDHYYIIIIISLGVLLLQLKKQNFPTWETIFSIIIILMLFLFNERIADVIFLLNGGVDFIQAHGNRITFASSLLETIPMVELVILSILLWRVGNSKQTIKQIN